ncbi:MAG: aminomethyl-transferring glycine dehydrogenase subunit GcvPB [Planctomycetota bacterium]
MEMEPLIFEKSRPGRVACRVSAPDEKAVKAAIPEKFRRKSPPALPEVGELDLVRHYVRLSRLNFSVDTHFYPLGSCTMKYNPKINDLLAGLPGFTHVHPAQPARTMQGWLSLIHDMEEFLKAVSGLDAVTLQPAAGAHGELTGLMVARAYFADRGETARVNVLVPDSAHGTNPASAAICGFRTKEIPSGPDGLINLEALKKALGPDTAVLMVTNPNTLGLFEERIIEIAEMVHDAGALLYMDGANLNAILGEALPGKFGVDVMHFNLHKTFSGPHGGGGPGSGPVGVKKHLEPYLPVPRIISRNGMFDLDGNCPKSIGKVRAAFGNLVIVVRAYCYFLALGREGMAEVSRHAVLNANYMMKRLKGAFHLPYDRPCMHEFVLSASKQVKSGVHALDIAKRLIDFKFHPPTIYFPLIVPEAVMIEPTETESKDEMDLFIAAMLRIAKEAKENPDVLHEAPHDTPVSRLDEVKAAKSPVLRCVGMC